MIMLPTVPSYTDVHNRWINYCDDQVNIVDHAFKSWCHSLDHVTWFFFHGQIDRFAQLGHKNAMSVKKLIRHNQIQKD